MREIKVRAWSSEQKKMFTAEEMVEDQLALLPNGYFINVHPIPKLSHVFPHSELLPLQFTGLKDKNGVEIYEGDIVRCYIGSKKGCPHEMIRVNDIGGEFGGGMPGFALKGLLRNAGKGYAWIGKEEVIGNIYENKNLLE